MAKKKRPADVNQLAKFIADLATGEAVEQSTTEGKDPTAVARGAKGGTKGGPARAATLSREQRVAIARKGATTRWRQK